MTLTTLFDDLPDLALIELFSYLSSLDILWGFTRLNSRLTALVAERGSFRHVNLSSAWHRQFDTLLRLVPLNEVESLTIDINASPLQLRRWPYLPRLTKLRLKGLREPDDALIFILFHAATLAHLKIESDDNFAAYGIVVNVEFPQSNIFSLVNNVLLHLPALRSLDLGIKYHVINWCVTDVSMHLTYLRVGLTNMNDLLRLMCTRPLCKTLQQLHVAVTNEFGQNPAAFIIGARSRLPQMTQLHTFTFVQTGPLPVVSAWPYVELFTVPSVMPHLRKIYLMIHMTTNDLNRMGQSPLFVDSRRVDVNFALLVNGDQQHFELTERVPRGSYFHPRQIAGATFIVSYWVNYQRDLYPSMPHPWGRRAGQHVWYTLPWAFTEVFELGIPDGCIAQLQCFSMGRTPTAIGASRLFTLKALGNGVPSPMHCLPHLISVNRIDTLHLFFCERPLFALPFALRHITLVNSPSLLENFPLFPPTVCSIQIELRYQTSNFVTPNWLGLRSLSALPMLNSLRLNLFDVLTMLDDISCQIIAETAPMVADFGICFRRRYGPRECGMESVFNGHATFIGQLRRRILALSSNKQPYSVVEYRGCGLTVWF